MYQLCSKITIAAKNSADFYTLDFSESISVSSSWDMLSSTAYIIFPKKIYVNKNNTPVRVSWENMNVANKAPVATGNVQSPDKRIFSEGDYVKIELGYNAELYTVFEGFIYGITEKVPMEVKCMDDIYILNRMAYSGAFEGKTTLKKVVGELYKVYNESAVHKEYHPSLYKKLTDFHVTVDRDLELSDFIPTQKTLAQIFSYLKKMYGIDTFIQNRALYCGSPYPNEKIREEAKKKSLFSLLKIKEKKRFGFQNNIIEDNLVAEFINSNKKEIIVTGIEPSGGKREDNKQVIVKASEEKDQDGLKELLEEPSEDSEILEGKTEIFDTGIKIRNNIFTTNVNTLKSVASMKSEKMIYEGYSGYFTTFGKPFVQHGDTVELQNLYMPAKSGKFKVKRVDYTFGSGGYRQKIELHKRVES